LDISVIFFRANADLSLSRQKMSQRLTGADADGPNYVTSMYDFFEIKGSIGAGPGHKRVEIVPEQAWFSGRESPVELGVTNRDEYDRHRARTTGIPPGDMPAPARLKDQLRLLPDRDPLRISIINGFGTGIGDTLIGLTAWRNILHVLAECGVENVDVDLWVRPRGFANARDVCAAEDAIDRVSLLPMPVSEFAERDAFFDLSGLVDRPGIDAQPMVDFFLSQMGVDSATVPSSRKRNSILCAICP
jgi:hypothetical protein